MAFNKSATTFNRDGTPLLVENRGSYSGFAIGLAALSGGTATVTVPSLREVHWAIAQSRSANRAYVSADTGNTFTITGSGSETVAWIAYGLPNS